MLDTLRRIAFALERIAEASDGGGGTGAREPRTPAPESPGDAIAQDYADSAE